MKRMIPCIVLTALAFPSQAAAQTPKRTQVMAYRAPLDYDGDTIKKDADVTGFYVYRGEGLERSYELGAETSSFNYTIAVPYDQQDYTFAFTKYNPRKSVRAGGHVVRTSAKTNDALTLFIGINDYSKKNKSDQIDFCVSSYDRLTPKLMAFQASFKKGAALNSGNDGGVFAATRIDLIQLSKEIGAGEKTFASAEQSLSLKTGPLTLTAHGWLGRRALAVRNDGFVVYNKPEKYKGGYGASANYAFDPAFNLTLGFARETFVDSDGLGGWKNDAETSKYMAALNYVY